MYRYVFCYEYYPNCPVHDGGVYTGLRKVESLEEIMDFALENLNEFGIIDIISLNDDDELYIKYNEESHQFNGIEIYINNELVKYTADNGAGKLVWYE